MQSKVVVGFFTALLLSGLVGCHAGSASLQPGETQARQRRAKAYSLYLSGRYRDAEQAYAQSYQLALALGNRKEAFRCLNGVGGMRFAMFQYREAMQAYLEARRLAQKIGDAEMLATVQTNLSSLYLQQQEVNAGARAADEALQALGGAGPIKFGPMLRTQSAILHSRQGDLDAALPLFGEALEEAAARGDMTTLSFIWDQLGYELLTRGRLEDAERALLEGFRIRKLNRLADLQYSYYTLGMLRLAQGDFATARLLLDESLARLSKAPATLALWRVYYERGRAESGMGRFEEALSDFRRAVEHARRVRLEVLPADSVWINTGVDQDRLYSALIHASATLYSQTGDAAYARLGFEAAEENRAAGLRALILSPDEWRRRLPSDYWEALARLRAMESKLLQADDSAVRDEMSRLQYRLTEMEAEAGLSLFPPNLPGSGVAPGLLQRVHAVVEDGEAYFSFYLAEPESFLWVVTRREFRMFHLPGRHHLAPLVSQFRAAVKQDLPEHVRLGQELYGALFSAVPEGLLASPRWSLALEGELYEVPMAALVISAPRAQPEYLAERHVIRMVPSALLPESHGRPVWDKPFVGVGDPIYNTADDRLPSGRRRGLLRAGEYLAILPRVFARAKFNGGAELARLAGSGGEIGACARAWGGEVGGSVLLTGPEASLKGLDRALMPGAAVLHFATHFLPSAASVRQAMIALSLDAQGAPELLGPAEISRRRLDLGLAVLSGCASASAEAVPAEGLMGMTRAWLAAGARSVLATLWPTPDDQGRLLVSFYTHLAHLRDRGDSWVVAEALRSAQLDALRSGAAYGSPAYWGAYILAGRE